MSLPLLPVLGPLFAGRAGIQATQAVTTTVVATPTRGSVLTPVAGANQIPQGSLDITRLADPNYLGQPAQAGLGAFSLFFLLLSAAALIAGVYYYFVGKRRWHRVHKLNYRLANFWSLVAMLLGGLGVLFFLFRVLGVEGLNARFWLYLLLVLMIGFLAYAAFYFRTRYPAELATYTRSLRPGSPALGRRRSAAAAPGTPPTVARPGGGTPGNPRGTSARGERRREKKR